MQLENNDQGVNYSFHIEAGILGILWLGGCLITIGLWLPSSLVRILLSGAAIWLVPGWLLARCIFSTHRDIGSLLVRGSLTGYLLFAIGVPVAYLTSPLNTHFLATFFLITPGLWVYFIFRQKHLVLITLPKGFIQYATFAIAVAIGLLSGWVGGYPDGDACECLSEIRAHMDALRVSTASAYYPNLPTGLQYTYSTIYQWFAMWAMAARVDVVALWLEIPFILTPLVILAISEFLRRMFPQDNRCQLITFLMILCFLSWGMPPGQFWRLSPFPFVWALCWLLFMGLTIWLEGHKRRHYLVPLIFLAMVGTHIFTAVYFGLILFIMFVWHGMRLLTVRQEEGDFKAVVVAGITSILVAAPLLGALYVKSYAPQNPMCINTLGDARYIMTLPFGRMIFNPLILSLWHILSFVLLVAAWRYRLWQERHWRWVIGIILLQPVLLFTPWLTAILADWVHTSLVRRMKWEIPNILLCGWAASLILKWLDTKHYLNIVQRIKAPWMFTLIAAFLLATVIWSFASSTVKKLVHFNKYQGPLHSTQTAIFASKQLPWGTVVLSDPYQSYHLPTFAPVFVVANSPRHTNPPVDILNRLLDVLWALDPYTTDQVRHDILAKYHVGALLIDTNLTPLLPNVLDRDPLLKRRLTSPEEHMLWYQAIYPEIIPTGSALLDRRSHTRVIAPDNAMWRPENILPGVPASNTENVLKGAQTSIIGRIMQNTNTEALFDGIVKEGNGIKWENAPFITIRFNFPKPVLLDRVSAYLWIQHQGCDLIALSWRFHTMTSTEETLYLNLYQLPPGSHPFTADVPNELIQSIDLVLYGDGLSSMCLLEIAGITHPIKNQ